MNVTLTMVEFSVLRMTYNIQNDSLLTTFIYNNNNNNLIYKAPKALASEARPRTRSL